MYGNNNDDRHALYTIGYEGKSLKSMIDVLQRKRINTLVDVREYPNSRKPGFSKNRLMKECNDNGINYCHFRNLGTNKKLRDEIRKTRDMSFFRREYLKIISKQMSCLEEIKHLMIAKNICLMCFEKEAENCHRYIVAEKIRDLNDNGLLIENL